MTSKRDAELIYEIGSMRHMARTWHQFGGLGFANVAEHSMRVAWIALLIAKQEGADTGKVVQLALIHDLPETRTGDVNYVSRMYVDRHEDRAMKDAAGGTAIEEHLLDLWTEFEQQQSCESRIVKDADTLDVDFELMERAFDGTAMTKELKPARDRLSKKLHTETARALYHLACTTNPHSWHLQGTNRVTAGDWKE